MIKRLIIFVYFFLLFLCFFSNCNDFTSLTWGIEVEIDKNVLNLIDLNPEKEMIISAIKSELSKNIYKTICSFDENKIINKDGLSTIGIIESWKKLINEIKNKKRIIKVIFSFDENHEKYYKKLIEKKKKNKYLRINDINSVDGHGVTNSIDVIKIMNTWKNFKIKLLKNEYNNVSYTITSEIISDRYDDSSDTIFGENIWYFKGIKKVNMCSVIFHELTHIALFNSNNNDVKSRYVDEATIEDIMLKIYPKDGCNYYEYNYNFYLFYIRKYYKYDIIKFMIIINIDSNGNLYIGRNFNPSDDKKYKNGKTFNGIFSFIDNSSADDCRDSEMRWYIFPN